MKTIAINQYGSADEFTMVDMPTTEPQADEVQVAIHAFSLNPMDIAGRMGALSSPFTDLWAFPLVLGWDFAGVITKMGKAVTGFNIGDAVFGSAAPAHAANNGTYGEFITVNTKELAHLPSRLIIWSSCCFANRWTNRLLRHEAQSKLQSGQKILVQGGAGGVGLFAIQIAKAFGAYVATTASANHRDLLTRLGADEVIDYHETDPAAVLHDYDAVFDTVGDIDTGLKVLKLTASLQPLPVNRRTSSNMINRKKLPSVHPRLITRPSRLSPISCQRSSEANRCDITVLRSQCH